MFFGLFLFVKLNLHFIAVMEVIQGKQCLVFTLSNPLYVYFLIVMWSKGSRGSSVSIEFGYGLDNWAIEVRSLTGAKYFSCSL
jgi:hypothetical protein